MMPLISPDPLIDFLRHGSLPGSCRMKRKRSRHRARKIDPALVWFGTNCMLVGLGRQHELHVVGLRRLCDSLVELLDDSL